MDTARPKPFAVPTCKVHAYPARWKAPRHAMLKMWVLAWIAQSELLSGLVGLEVFGGWQGSRCQMLDAT